MDIPAFFAASSNRRTVCIDSTFQGMLPTPSSGEIPLSEISDRIRREVRAPVVVMDHSSLRNRSFNGSLTKHLKVRGTEPWLMTHVETVDDLFDAFNGNTEMVLAPLHTILSEYELEDIHAVSDSFIPVVYCTGAEAMVMKGRRSGIGMALDDLADHGFYKVCIMDCDGSIEDSEWESIAEDHPSVIPFNIGRDARIQGFEVGISVIGLH